MTEQDSSYSAPLEPQEIAKLLNGPFSEVDFESAALKALSYIQQRSQDLLLANGREPDNVDNLVVTLSVALLELQPHMTIPAQTKLVEFILGPEDFDAEDPMIMAVNETFPIRTRVVMKRRGLIADIPLEPGSYDYNDTVAAGNENFPLPGEGFTSEQLSLEPPLGREYPAVDDPDIVKEAQEDYRKAAQTAKGKMADQSRAAKLEMGVRAKTAENDLETRSERELLLQVTELARRGRLLEAVSVVHEAASLKASAEKFLMVLDEFVMTTFIKLIENSNAESLRLATQMLDDLTSDPESVELIKYAASETVAEQALGLIANGKPEAALPYLALLSPTDKEAVIEWANHLALENAINQLMSRPDINIEQVIGHLKEQVSAEAFEYISDVVRAFYSSQGAY